MTKQTLVFCLLSFVLCAQPAMASDDDSLYLDTASANARMRFGFMIGSNNSLFYAQSALSGQLPLTTGSGYRLGLHAQYNVSPRFSLTGKGEMSYNNSKMRVTDNEGITYESTMSPVTLGFFLHGLFRVAMLDGGKKNIYLTGGPGYRLPVKSENLPQRIYGNTPDLCADMGIGVELRLRHFTVAPEIRYTYGFDDIDKSPFIASVYHHQISFGVVFKD